MRYIREQMSSKIQTRSNIGHLSGNGHLLNPEQLRAVEILDGPLLILAGAGSGKTRVLTFRMANLIASGTCQPQEIFAVTFTNKAARSMGERTVKLLYDFGIPIHSYPWISTFHSACAKMLREHHGLLGFDAPFVIYDDSEQLSVVKKVTESLGFDEKVYPPRGFQHRINEAKNLGMTPEELSTRALNFMDEKLLKVYTAYEKLMFQSNALDFGDLLFKTYTLFRDHPKVLDGYRDRLKYIMVDEYQDTNHIQYKLVNLLAHRHRNLCVVGDEDQSIYSWRGADITNILNFKQDYPEVEIVKLQQNYRSTQTIVNAASQLIKNNTQRNDKTLFSENSIGEKIRLHEAVSEQNEAQWVVKQIQALIDQGEAALQEIAVFYRTNAQSRVLEDQFRMNNLPYKIIGAVNFYDRAEIKDVVAYLKLIVNPKDDLSLFRIINRPARRIGKTSIEKIEALAQQKNIPAIEAVQVAIENREVHSGALKGLESFYNTLAELRSLAASLCPLETYELVLEKTGYLKMLEEEHTLEAQNRIENLQELKSAIHQFEKEQGESSRLVDFLEEMSLVTDRDKMDETAASVTLMTLHLSKGLEYPVVFIVGLEEGLFPSRQSFDSLDPSALEEERRLCYVGMTRAEKKLFMTHARQRFLRGTQEYFPPSRFLSEIPPEFISRCSAIPSPRRFSSFGDDSSDQRSYKKSFQENIFPDYESPQENPEWAFKKGMKVRHPIFGLGIVHQLEGEGENKKVTVLFNSTTLKKFALRFARLERLG